MNSGEPAGAARLWQVLGDADFRQDKHCLCWSASALFISRDLGFALLELLLSIGFTIVAVRLLVINGLERLARVLGWSAKTQGQILGYATSLPELVAVLATALNGRESLEGGFWNIASSNVINLVLFLAAVVFYLRYWELLNPRFIEEISFCGFSVLLPWCWLPPASAILWCSAWRCWVASSATTCWTTTWRNCRGNEARRPVLSPRIHPKGSQRHTHRQAGGWRRLLRYC